MTDLEELSTLTVDDLLQRLEPAPRGKYIFHMGVLAGCASNCIEYGMQSDKPLTTLPLTLEMMRRALETVIQLVESAGINVPRELEDVDDPGPVFDALQTWRSDLILGGDERR